MFKRQEEMKFKTGKRHPPSSLVRKICVWLKVISIETNPPTRTAEGLVSLLSYLRDLCLSIFSRTINTL